MRLKDSCALHGLIRARSEQRYYLKELDDVGVVLVVDLPDGDLHHGVGAALVFFHDGLEGGSQKVLV